MKFSCWLSGLDMLELEARPAFGKVLGEEDVSGKRAKQGWCEGSLGWKTHQTGHYLDGLDKWDGSLSMWFALEKVGEVWSGRRPGSWAGSDQGLRNGEVDRVKNVSRGSSRHGTVETNPIRNHEVSGLILGLTQWIKDPALLWAMV